MIWTHLLAAIVAASLAFSGAWTVQNWRYGAKEAERLEDAAESKRMNERAADAGSAGHEADKATIKTRFITIKKEAQRAAETPTGRATCLNDDSLRILTRALSGEEPAAGQPAPAVPRPDSPR